MIQPSSALIVRADLAIGDCVRKMRDAGVGSVLVVSDDQNLEPIGMFTERDLIRNIDEIQHGGHWNRAVRTVMSKKLVTLPIEDLKNASKLMLEKGFRHLPLTQRNPNGKASIVGIISMRDLFKDAVDQLGRYDGAFDFFSPRGQKPTQLAIAAIDPGVARVIQNLYGTFKNLKIRAETQVPLDHLEGIHALLYDLDGRQPAEWSATLRALNQNPDAPFTVVSFSGDHINAESRAILTKLGESRKFAVFEKPLNVFGVLRQLDPFVNL